MNQHQRKFLLDQIEGLYKLEHREVAGRKPQAPSLNNYLIAAILDGSAVMKPTEAIREAIRTRVRDLGKAESLVTSTRSNWGSSRKEGDEDQIALPALLLFETPPAFATKQAEYEAALKTWNEEMAALQASINAMRIKVQVGSDKALESLVDQADNICRMSLSASSRLLLPSAS